MAFRCNLSFSDSLGPLQEPSRTTGSRILDQRLEVNPEAYRGGTFGRTNPTSKRLAIATQVRIPQVTSSCQGLIWPVSLAHDMSARRGRGLRYAAGRRSGHGCVSRKRPGAGDEGTRRDFAGPQQTDHLLASGADSAHQSATS